MRHANVFWIFKLILPRLDFHPSAPNYFILKNFPTLPYLLQSSEDILTNIVEIKKVHALLKDGYKGLKVSGRY